ncbi:hypothetical protein DFA_00256 [Cavenderia fasciculata]|uniref:Uncharacterized protein n=1 Tax=Cavenderia fasciculata TaxID=261658 RepID=F4PY18_CACFS|nr:uncharacterized protein DFA_00256 [Cavenderia fasciculata]EGG19678.1 hypothetical protein DFA_00256 [Cavenderia fasciculata]|eukprot:XP_004357972.1 hypothetical protein DFA_00256 [Cavenderia fasciculata]
MTQTINNMLYLVQNNHAMCKVLANRKIVMDLIETSKLITKISFAKVTRDKTNLGIAFIRAMCVEEARVINIISALLPHFESIHDIPIQELVGYSKIGGFPIEILVAEMLAKYLVSDFNNHALSILYFKSGVGNLLIKLACQQKKILVIQTASLLMFEQIGKEFIDNTDLLNDNEKKVANIMFRHKYDSLVKLIIKKGLNNKDLFESMFVNGLILFGCGAISGWRQGLSIPHIYDMGMLYYGVEMARQLFKYQIKERLKSRVCYPTIILSAAMSVPYAYLGTTMLKISPIPVILLQIGRSLYSNYISLKQVKKAIHQLHNQDMVVQYHQRIQYVGSLFQNPNKKQLPRSVIMA